MKKSWGLLGGISYGDSWALETRTEEVRGLYYISKLAMCMSALAQKVRCINTVQEPGWLP